uniref:D-beta-hydroxybutyrate dehydrogenase, mitochondrial-like protein n=1 Tax=Daphnia magna TaxID=35525 RepID=A0A0P4XHT6_9CRUS
MRVTKAFLPLIRKSQGRIVNVSSILGRVADPFLGAYCISKFALEAFSEILRFQMVPFNVKVNTIEPGNFLSAVNITAGIESMNAATRSTWDQLDEPDFCLTVDGRSRRKVEAC